MTTSPLWQLTATDLSTQLQNGDITVEAAVQSSVDRMAAANPDLNAVVVDLSAQALDRAVATVPGSA